MTTRRTRSIEQGPGMRIGDVCDGWTPRAWAAYLRQRAAGFDERHQAEAAEWRRWADIVDERESQGSVTDGR